MVILTGGDIGEVANGVDSEVCFLTSHGDGATDTLPVW